MLPHTVQRSTAMLMAIATTSTLCATIALGHDRQQGKSLTPLTASGCWMVDPAGNKVILKGCNLGNWLLIEPWMLGLADQFRDQYQIITTLEERFGSQRTEQLMDTYRANWITSREFKIVKSFGFNLVRVPIHHHLLTTEKAPFELRDDAFQWLDRAVQLAEEAGVYVILDLHGTPGGQSADMTTGRIGQNKLWFDKIYQQRTIFLWKSMADRYKDRACVVAYDLINEPWGRHSDDIRPQLVSLVDRLVTAIREIDPDTLILAPGSTRGIGCYGDPRERNWHKVGFTDHFYPGLFHNGDPLVSTHLDFLNYIVPAQSELLGEYAVPYLVGEFNMVFDYVAQPEMMRLYYDTFAKHGWLSTMWSLRLLTSHGGVTQDNWYLATNTKPFTLPDLRSASYEQIESSFKQLGTMKLELDEEVREALTASKPSSLSALVSNKHSHANKNKLPSGWKTTAIGGAKQGAASQLPNGDFAVTGGGADLWSTHDEFQFVYKPAEKNFEIDTWITSFDVPHKHTKAGWMLRSGTSPSDPHLLIHVFEDGRIMLAWRESNGQPMHERCLAITGFPVGIGLTRDSSGLYARFTDLDGNWHQQKINVVPKFDGKQLLGLVVCSHNDYAMANVTFKNVETANSNRPRSTGSRNLLKNGSFEDPVAEEGVRDRAEHWPRWGDWFNREDNWTPTRDGHCLVGYHHWDIKSNDSSGIYQDVTGLTPGKQYTFSIDANRDIPGSNVHGPKSVELRLESLSKGRLLKCASHYYDPSDIESGDNWSRLQVTGMAVTDTLRVLVIVNPNEETPRGAAMKFDNATLCEAEDSK